MYELKRAKKSDLGVTIGGQEIPVVLDFSKYGQNNFIARYTEAQNAEAQLTALLSSAGTKKPEDLARLQTAYGNGVIGLLDLLFGTTNSKVILDFYENDYGELLTAICPFITGEVVPELERIKKSRAKAYEGKGGRFWRH